MSAAASKRAKTPDLLASFDLDSPHATEVRRLLQALWSDPANRERKSFMVTSAGRGEGKSTTCALMGIVAARIFRRRTVVIDADLWRPTMHRALGVSFRPGLADLLAEKASIDAVIRPTLLPTLSVIPAGAASMPIAQLFNEEVFANVIARCREQFDLVLVDSAPMVPVVEPVMMAQHIDGIVIVALAGRTPLNLVRRLKQITTPFRERVVGVILNNATRGLPYYYEHSYYGYHKSSRRGAQPNVGDAASTPTTSGGDAGTS
ncbi:MAG TPA: CpsD/CapB family tyrosine-protein kinase [Candidatus Eisenbacteria bacterium]|nr:CpsD/CapB family tyrosine-protein kinase [Candidatus Eisenbacteria bacterium]